MDNRLILLVLVAFVFVGLGVGGSIFGPGAYDASNQVVLDKAVYSSADPVGVSIVTNPSPVGGYTARCNHYPISWTYLQVISGPDTPTGEPVLTSFITSLFIDGKEISLANLSITQLPGCSVQRTKPLDDATSAMAYRCIQFEQSDRIGDSSNNPVVKTAGTDSTSYPSNFYEHKTLAHLSILNQNLAPGEHSLEIRWSGAYGGIGGSSCDDVPDFNYLRGISIYGANEAMVAHKTFTISAPPASITCPAGSSLQAGACVLNNPPPTQSTTFNPSSAAPSSITGPFNFMPAPVNGDINPVQIVEVLVILVGAYFLAKRFY